MYPIRPWLFVGKYRETLDRRLLTINRIGAMLQLAEPVEQPGVVSLYLPVDDGVPLPEGLLRQGVDFVREERRRGQRVLIACGAGISRSVTFAVATLKEEEGLTLLDALRTVRQRHPDGMPHPALWRSLCSYYQEDAPFEELHTLDHH
jgi:protein-tyrosine phosphatase